MSAHSIYTDELGDRIIELMCIPMSIANIAKQEGMPSRMTIIKWGNDESHPFSEKYENAFKIRADILADDCLDIADDDSDDVAYDNQGNVKLNREFFERSKLKIQERHWQAAVMNRKKFGDKATHELTGQNGTPLIPTSIIFETDAD